MAKSASPAKKSSLSRQSSPPLDLSAQIESRAEFAGKPTVLPPLNEVTQFRRTFVVGEMGGSGSSRERAVRCCFWTDLRRVDPEELPPVDGPTYGLWVIEPSADDPSQPGLNAFMGMLYTTPEGRHVLAASRGDADRELDAFVANADHFCDDCTTDDLGAALTDGGDAVLIATTDCVRTNPVTLSARVSSGYFTTRAAAINAAITNAQNYADGVTRARGRRQSCGFGCVSCSSASAVVTITSRDSSVSLLASLFYRGWRYTGTVNFDYSFNVGCCRIGAA